MDKTIRVEARKSNGPRRILDLMEEIQGMPELDLDDQLRGFDISLFVFVKNYDELSDLIVFVTKDEHSVQLFSASKSDQLDVMFREIIRRLHNFVASAVSLIDHTRRLYNKLYKVNGRFPDYQGRIDRDFASDPLSNFVKCLRHYCVHYGAPLVGGRTSWTRGDEHVTRSIHLVAEQLKLYDRWTATAKEYFEQAPEQIDLAEMIDTYNHKVLAFHEWFRSRQREIHAGEYERLASKQRELALLMLEDNIASFVPDEERGLRYVGDEIFLHIFSSREFDELDNLPAGSGERADRAISLLEEMFSFSAPNDIRQKIRTWYDRNVSRAAQG